MAIICWKIVQMAIICWKIIQMAIICKKKNKFNWLLFVEK